MPKLIIQIPCFNEQDSLPVALAALPASLPGYDAVEIMVVDDGSTDNTVAVARAHGVAHIVMLPHRGLAQTYLSGIREAYARGADVVVNLDADNQYNADDIPLLLAPIHAGEAECVIGERPIEMIEHFSWKKKLLIRAGSWFVSKLAGVRVMDAPSGFRALSRTAMPLLEIHSRYTYTLEMLICLAAKGMRIRTVQARTNADLRPSRLIRSNAEYLAKGFKTISIAFARYHPLKCVVALLVFGLALYALL